MVEFTITELILENGSKAESSLFLCCWFFPQLYSSTSKCLRIFTFAFKYPYSSFCFTLRIQSAIAYSWILLYPSYRLLAPSSTLTKFYFVLPGCKTDNLYHFWTLPEKLVHRSSRLSFSKSSSAVWTPFSRNKNFQFSLHPTRRRTFYFNESIFFSLNCYFQFTRLRTIDSIYVWFVFLYI